MLGFFANGSVIRLQTKKIRSNIKVNDKCDRINDGGDKGARHNGGIYLDTLGKNGKGTSNEFCHKHSQNQRQGDNECHKCRLTVDEHDLEKGNDGKRQTA